MFSAPYRAVREATKAGRLGDLNPTPWAFMVGVNTAWVAYGLLTWNLFIFMANAPGFMLGIWLNFAAVKVSSVMCVCCFMLSIRENAFCTGYSFTLYSLHSAYASDFVPSILHLD
jgi:hypothetical protein